MHHNGNGDRENNDDQQQSCHSQTNTQPNAQTSIVALCIGYSHWIGLDDRVLRVDEQASLIGGMIDEIDKGSGQIGNLETSHASNHHFKG